VTLSAAGVGTTIVPPNAEQSAIYELVENLARLRLKVEQAQEREHYPWDFHLSDEEWQHNKHDLIGWVREIVGKAYIRANHLDAEVHRRENNGSEIQASDDLPGLLALMEAAEQALKKRLGELG